MADAVITPPKTDEKVLTIPPEVMEKFSELIGFIKASKSMNFDERQYWIDVLPIMSEDQIANLRGILDNEKKQLAQAAGTFSEGLKNTEDKAKKAFDEKAYNEKKHIREEAERLHEEEESKHEENILKELEGL